MEDKIGIGKFLNVVKAKLTGDLTQVEKETAKSLGERFDSRGIEDFLLGKNGKKRTDALRIMGDAMLLRIFSGKANDVLESLEAARLIFKEGFQPSYDRALSASAALQFYPQRRKTPSFIRGGEEGARSRPPCHAGVSSGRGYLGPA